MKGEATEARGALSAFLYEWKGRAIRSIERRGVSGTLLLAGKAGPPLMARQLKRCVTRNPHNPLSQYIDRRYDRRFGVDTAGIDWIPEVQVESANAYSPVSRSIFNRTMRELALDCSRFVFVDFGCGKGKTLLMAAESPFKQVIGIEISTKLAQIAEDNIRVYTGERKCSDSRVVCADARQYVLPSEPAVVFFYDPFKLEAMTTVLENIRRSLIATPREVYVVYVEASWRSLLDDAPFLVPLKQDRWYSLYKALS